MFSFDEAGGVVRRWLVNLAGQASTRAAVAGNGIDALEIDARPNWIYARLGDASGEVMEVHTSSVRPNYDDIFYIAREGVTGLGGWRSMFWLRDGTDATLPAPIPGSDRIRHLLCDSNAVQLVDSDGVLLESQ